MCVWHCILSAYQIAWRYEKCYNDNMVLNFDPYVSLNSFKVHNILLSILIEIVKSKLFYVKSSFSQKLHFHLGTYRSNYKKKNLICQSCNFLMQQKFVKMKSVMTLQIDVPQKLISRNFLSKTCDKSAPHYFTHLKNKS